MNKTWTVKKFGGASLADAGRYHSAGRTLLSLERRDGARVAALFSDLLRLASYMGAPR
jgi:aspartokinase